MQTLWIICIVVLVLGCDAVLPYNASGSSVPLQDPYDLSFSNGATLISNPTTSIRSGDPNQVSTATSMAYISNSMHKIVVIHIHNIH